MSHTFQVMGMSVTEGASPLGLEALRSCRSHPEGLWRQNQYLRGESEREFYAADSDPVMPQNFASILEGILGLENYTRPMPAEYPCSGPYCPQGIQVGYSLSGLYGNGYDGTGQKVAIVDLPGDPNIQNTINVYSNQYGLPLTTLDIRYPDGYALRPMITVGRLRRRWMLRRCMPSLRGPGSFSYMTMSV